jgi:membrane-associated HD superfamily phosphohydrolase
MYIGMIILVIFMILIAAGLMGRLLDAWHIKESSAFLICLLTLGGLLIPPINIADTVILSVGGFIIPMLVFIWMLARAQRHEILRTLLATLIISIVSGIIVFNFPLDSQTTLIETSLLLGLVAGGIAFLIGRTRRGAFISAGMGVLLTNIFIFLYMLIMGVSMPVLLGTGNQFNAVIISVITAVFVAEVAGEAMEYVKEDKTDVRFLNIDDYVNKVE